MAEHRTRSATQRRYPPEMRERAVRMVLQTAGEQGHRFGVVTRVARQLGIGPESLRTWVHQAEVDGGRRTGLTTEERERLKVLERENRELRRANEILKSAAAFFGAELDRRGPWRSVDQVELATAEWVHFWNTRRLHSACGDIPPTEFEAAHHQRLLATSEAA